MFDCPRILVKSYSNCHWILCILQEMNKQYTATGPFVIIILIYDMIILYDTQPIGLCVYCVYCVTLYTPGIRKKCLFRL